MMADGALVATRALLLWKIFLDDLLNNNIDEEMKVLLSQQDNVEETVGNQITFRWRNSRYKIFYGKEFNWT